MDISAIIVAVIGAAAVLAGVYSTRLGQRAESRQKELAERAAEEHLEFKELQDIVEMHRRDRDDARAAMQREREEMERERRLRIEAQTAADLAVEQARRTARQALADADALREVVRNEIAAEAARTAAEIKQHEEKT